jgi:hypothetical protein
LEHFQQIMTHWQREHGTLVSAMTKWQEKRAFPGSPILNGKIGIGYLALYIKVAGPGVTKRSSSLENDVSRLGIRAPQFLAKIRMCNFNQRGSALSEGLAEQIDGAVLGDDPMDVAGVVTTPAPGFRAGTMRETDPPAAVDGSAMIGRPSRDNAAPRMKSIWPPIPE